MPFWIRSQPALWVCGVFALGLALAERFPMGVAGPMASVVGLVGLGCVARRWCWILLLTAVGVCGVVRQGFFAQGWGPADLREQVGEDAQLVTSLGVIVSAPEVRRRGESAARGAEGEDRTRMVVAVDRLLRAGEWRDVRGRVLVTVDGAPASGMWRGARVRVTGAMGRPPRAAAPGMFDYREYLSRLGVHYEQRAWGWEECRVLGVGGARAPFEERFGRWARQTLLCGLPGVDGAVELIWAMVLGWRTALTPEVSEPFVRSGTMHLFAVSGLHLVLIAWILAQLIRACGVPTRWVGGVLIPLLWWYTAVIGWQASAVRAALMSTLFYGGVGILRPTGMLNSLGAAGVVILAVAPGQLFLAGFQLSFVVVFALGLFMPRLTALGERGWAPDPLLTADQAERGRWVRGAIRWIYLSGAVSLCSWLGALPLVAAGFHMVTPVTLAANMAMVPLGSLALSSAVGSLLCGGLGWEGGVELLNHSGWWWMRCLVECAEWCAGLPWAWFPVAGPRAAWIVCYYVCLVGVSVWRELETHRSRCMLGAGWVLTLILALVGSARAPVLTLTFPVMDRGEAILVEERSVGTGLIDAGGTRSYEPRLRPLLASRGVARLDWLWLTHGDSAHVGGAIGVLNDFVPREVGVSGVRFRSGVYRGALVEIEAREEWHRRRLVRGESFRGWRVVHPAAGDRGSVADDTPVGLSWAMGSVRLLLVSDLSRRGQEVLMEREARLEADILVMGFESTGAGPVAGFLDRVAPRFVVFTRLDGRRAGGGVPRWVRELAARRIPWAAPERDGPLAIRVWRDGWKVEGEEGGLAQAEE